MNGSSIFILQTFYAIVTAFAVHSNHLSSDVLVCHATLKKEEQIARCITSF